ncbi:MAG: hypothetical protein ACE5OR_10285 [bacterium]
MTEKWWIGALPSRLLHEKVTLSISYLFFFHTNQTGFILFEEKIAPTFMGSFISLIISQPFSID